MRFAKLLLAVVAVCSTVDATEDEEYTYNEAGERVNKDGERVYTGEDFSEKSMQEQSKKDFDDLDANKDGSLEREELVSYLTQPHGDQESSQRAMTKEEAEKEVEEFFGEADSDGNNKVDFNEYWSFVQMLFEKYKGESESHPVNMGFDDLDFGDDAFELDDDEL